jgi:hypothetical protein
MTAIIYQLIIDKKRKKCGVMIEMPDKKKAGKYLISPSVHRLNQ